MQHKNAALLRFIRNNAAQAMQYFAFVNIDRINKQDSSYFVEF